MAQVIESLPGKYKALSSTSSTAKKKKFKHYTGTGGSHLES
jgi:hypothetical protein